MDGKIIVIVVLALVLYSAGCFDQALGSASTSSAAATGELVEPDSRACYADAQAQLSPQWAAASRLDRALAALTVINVCEGSN